MFFKIRIFFVLPGENDTVSKVAPIALSSFELDKILVPTTPVVISPTPAIAPTKEQLTYFGPNIFAESISALRILLLRTLGNFAPLPGVGKCKNSISFSVNPRHEIWYIF